MKTPRVCDLALARDYFAEQRQQLDGVDDVGAMHQFDVLSDAIRECEELIRDGRSVEDVQEHTDHARGQV